MNKNTSKHVYSTTLNSASPTVTAHKTATRNSTPPGSLIGEFNCKNQKDKFGTYYLPKSNHRKMSEVWLTFALKCNNLYKGCSPTRKHPRWPLPIRDLLRYPQDDFRIWLRDGQRVDISPTQLSINETDHM